MTSESSGVTVAVNALSSPAQAIPHLLSVSEDLPLLGISYKQNHTDTICGLLTWPLSFCVTLFRFTHVVAHVNTWHFLVAW